MLTIKAKKGKHGEIRRASFKTPATFAEFTNIFRESFGPLPEDYKLKFEDDEGDLVVLSNQSDYEEALRVVANSEPQILRITIVSKHEHKEEAAAPKAPHCAPRGCPAFAGGCGAPAGNPLGPLAALLEMGKASLPDLLKNPALRSMAEGLMHSNMVKVVQPYVCDACNANISGDRFNSTVDPNFDLCKACMESPKGAELEAKYKFKRVSALEALVETLTNGGSFDAFFAPGRADEPEPVARHHAICDVCNQGIVGIRHKCLDCADYDECNVCHLRPAPHVAGHVFHPIQDPAQRTVSAEVMEAHKAKRAAAEEEAKRVAAAAAAAAAEAEAKARKEAEEAEAKARAAAEEAAKARAEAEAKSKALLTKLVPVEPKKTEEAKPVAAAPAVPVPEDKEPSAFERNLTTLESMGFSDRKRNIQVLVRNRNRLFESIQELLQ